MSKSIKLKNIWIVLGIAFVLINGALFYLYPGNFSIFAYVLFLFIPLAAAIVIIFTRFSLLFIKDIEEEKEEKKLLQERQRDIFENITEGLVVHDPRGKILTMNAAAEQFLGIKEAEIKTRPVEEIKNYSDLSKAIFEDLKEGEIFEYSFDKGSGEKFDYQIIKITLNKERGESLKIIRDVSRSKYLDRMKTEYVTIMSHKFLTPLTNIRWSTDFLLGNSADAKKNEENLKNILNNVERLVKLTSYLLDIAEIEEGLFGYNFEKLDMSLLIEETVKNFSDDSKQKKISLIYHKPKGGHYLVSGDRNRLSVAISNYLDNAIKYTPENGQVEIFLGKTADELKVSVADNGIIISPESARLLFSKFFRDKWAKSLHTEGSGLGLFIVKNIVERHGGKAGYLADDHRGSTFFFTLPLYKEKT
ncbi:MAG: PAS domain S-box protein [Patescibacteria group bacterium]|nr:PAS domain S-box protein [Patescibacteria group bacterium]MDE1988385.1 PAS domain S-box protein [Patescibacteria group bacterium]MDE2217884.1 PAS domain S-box protein [Patescibacteria group bacterium]